MIDRVSPCMRATVCVRNPTGAYVLLHTDNDDGDGAVVHHEVAD